jgi:cytoskeleton protein RodZ
VFEIGNSLREARLRQNLDFGSVETGTKIRSKYIQALEGEHFEVLPGETYVKGFLRTYAEFLGLDGQLYVDEFNSRFASAEEPLAGSSSPPRSRRERHRVGDSNLVVVALAAIVAVTILVVVAFGFGSEEPTADPSVPQQTESTQPNTGTTATSTSAGEGGNDEKPDQAKLVLTAADGDCWLSVRAGGARGEQLFVGTLEQGQRQAFTRKRLWVQVGQPAVLDVTLNGFRIADFPAESGAVVTVTADGIRQVAAT